VDSQDAGGGVARAAGVCGGVEEAHRKDQMDDGKRKRTGKSGINTEL